MITFQAFKLPHLNRKTTIHVRLDLFQFTSRSATDNLESEKMSRLKYSIMFLHSTYNLYVLIIKAYLDSLFSNLLDDGLKIILDLHDVSLEAQSTLVPLPTHHLGKKQALSHVF